MIEVVKILKRFFQVFFLVAIDLLGFYTSLFIAWLLRTAILDHLLSGLPASFSYAYFISLWWIPVMYLFFQSYEGLYSSNLPFWDEARKIVKAVSLATIAVMAIVTLGKMSDRISRLVLFGMWGSSLFIFPLLRLWGKKLLCHVGIWREKVLILGAGNAGRLAMEGLERERHMGYVVIGFLDDDVSKKGQTVGGKRVFGKVKYFPRYVNKLGIKTVIIAMPSLQAERLSSLTMSVQSYAANTIVIPDLKGVALLNTELLHLFYEEMFLMNIRNNLKSAINRITKRLFDICASIVSLPFLLPVIWVVSLAIRLETPGHAIYAHDRIGKDGKTFRCYKFRTMQRDAEERLKELLEEDESLRHEWERHWKLKDDPRVTRIGRFLRKTSLDELPQLFNVLKGEMSLVGPRPYLPKEKNDIGKHYYVICSARPGITGLWQVSGRSRTSYDYRIKLDSWYVRNWSLWLDIAILFKTLRVVSKMDGAY